MIKQFTMTCAATLSLIGAAAASAAPINGSFGLSAYQGNAGGNIASPGAQATLSNPLIGTPALYSGTYTGEIDFSDGGINNLLNFIQSAGGSLSGSTSGLNVALSDGGFNLTSVLVITGTVASPITGTLSHDDGVGLYQGGSLLTPGATSPTNIADTPYSLSAGTFTLVYVATNGLPEVLTMDVNAVPAPASLALLGLALAGMGIARRKKVAV